MALLDPIRRTWIAFVPAVAGLALFASALAGEHRGQLTTRNIILATAAAGVVWLALNADPAWLISGGIVAGVFNGNWRHLHFGSTLVPDRVLLAAGLLALLLRIPPQAKERPPIRSRFEYWLVGAAALYVTLSAIAAGTIESNDGLFRLLDRFGVIPFFMFAAAPVAFRTRRQRWILLGALTVTGAYLGFVTWADALKFEALVWPKYILDPAVGITHGRGRGPFAAADANGLALMACTTAALIGFWHWRPRLVRLACGGVAALCLSGTFLTLTRSVWVGAAAACIVTMLAFRELRRYFVPAAVAATMGVLALLAIPGMSERATKRQHDERPVWDRKNSNAAGLRMLADRPLFGFGWNTYLDHNADYFVQDPNFPLTGYRVPLHNVYLSNAVELGLIGTALWLFAAIVAIGGTIVRRGPPELYPWRIGLVALGVQWAVQGALAPFPYSFPNLIIWTWAGVAGGLLPQQLAAASRVRARPGRGPTGVPVHP